MSLPSSGIKEKVKQETNVKQAGSKTCFSSEDSNVIFLRNVS
jgi:hypothetical protein